MNIKIIEPIGQSETAIRSQLKELLGKGGHRLFICDTRGLIDAALFQIVRDANVLLLGYRLLSRVVIEACPNLNLICGAFTGVDHVDEEACKARGIILCNAAGHAIHAVSELAIGLMIAVLRRIVSADATIRSRARQPGVGPARIVRQDSRSCRMRCHWVASCPPRQSLWLPAARFRTSYASGRRIGY
jgi:D-3-phosphoglycerate dehydrogenase